MEYIYQNPYAPKLQEYRVRVTDSVSHWDLRFGERLYLEQLYKSMRERLADFVAQGNMSRMNKTHETEFSLDMYAIPPTVLHDVIETEVQRRLTLANNMRVVGE